MLAQTLARQATVLIHSIESALQTPADDAAAASDFVHLSFGPVRLLGLGSLGPEILSDASDRLWRTTAAVSLAVTLVGYGYCKAKSDRRRAQLQQTLDPGNGPDRGSGAAGGGDVFGRMFFVRSAGFSPYPSVESEIRAKARIRTNQGQATPQLTTPGSAR